MAPHLGKLPAHACALRPVERGPVEARRVHERQEPAEDGGGPRGRGAPFDRAWHENIATTTPHLAHLTEFFADNDDPRLETARNNSWLQAGYFILAVRAQGLAAGPMIGFDASAVDAEFFPDGRWGSFLVVNIGHPTEGSYRPRLPRLDQEHTVRFA